MTAGHTDGPAGSPGLRAMRASLTPVTLMTTGPGYLVLQTASRGDFREGNALHVEGVVEAEDVGRWAQAFAQRLGHLAGVEHVLLRWETDGSFAAAGDHAERLARAGAEHGLTLERLSVMELTADPRPLVPLTDGVEVVRADRDEHWWGVRALQISAAGGEAAFNTWRTDQLRDLARHGGGSAWLAYRFGVPAAAAGVWRDRDGIAVVDDVVTHAVHRRLGIASHLVAVAAAAHRRAFPDDRLLLLVEHGADAERLYAKLGFAALGTVWGLAGPGPVGSGRR